MSFLKAEWRKLILVNYVVDPALLQQYVPSGTELDFWEGKCYVSLVGFIFKNTRVLGVKVPGHVDFEEVNLRFYVIRKEDGKIKRGVVFIKEIVPKAAITLIANTLYREHYVTREMDHKLNLDSEGLNVGYAWNEKGVGQNFGLHTGLELQEFEIGSEAEFITEHYWGYSKFGASKTNEYEVTHPKWQIYPVKEYSVNVQFDLVYGDEFKVLNTLEPTSVFLAEGSEITVESKKRIV